MMFREFTTLRSKQDNILRIQKKKKKKYIVILLEVHARVGAPVLPHQV
jgi:hypothetical protein